MEVKQGDKEANLLKARQFLEKAAREKVDLACFPEYFSTGFDRQKLNMLAEEIPGYTTNILKEESKKYGMWISAPILEKYGKCFYSTLVLIGPRGDVLCLHRKAHLWINEPRQENEVLTPGEKFEVTKVNDSTIGAMIDADMDFPETARILALKGAEIFLIPLSAEKIYLNVIRLVPVVRAIDNVAYVITTNRLGHSDGFEYAGGSMIISPLGEILSSINNEEGIITAILDLESLRKWRKEAWSPFTRFNLGAYRELKDLWSL
jgi:predicted amidohydrolase